MLGVPGGAAGVTSSGRGRHEPLLVVDAEDVDRNGLAVARLRNDRDGAGGAVEALRPAERALDLREIEAPRPVDRPEQDPRRVVREGAPHTRLPAEGGPVLADVGPRGAH